MSENLVLSSLCVSSLMSPHPTFPTDVRNYRRITVIKVERPAANFVPFCFRCRQSLHRGLLRCQLSLTGHAERRKARYSARFFMAHTRHILLLAKTDHVKSVQWPTSLENRKRFMEIVVFLITTTNNTNIRPSSCCCSHVFTILLHPQGFTVYLATMH